MSGVEIIEIRGISRVFGCSGGFCHLCGWRDLCDIIAGPFRDFSGSWRPFSVSFHVEKHKSRKYHLQKITFLEIVVSVGCQTLLWRFLADNH